MRFLNSVSVLAVVVLAGAAGPLSAQEVASAGEETRVIDRFDVDRADEVLVTRSGDLSLLITEEDLVVQLTDQGIGGIQAERSEDETVASHLLEVMLHAGLRELLDHGLAVPFTEVGRAEVEGQRLVIADREGKELFELTVNGRDVMEDFDIGEAREFAREVRRRIR